MKRDTQHNSIQQNGSVVILSAIMLSVPNNPYMLCLIMLNVIMLSVVAAPRATPKVELV